MGAKKMLKARHLFLGVAQDAVRWTDPHGLIGLRGGWGVNGSRRRLGMKRMHWRPWGMRTRSIPGR